MENVKQFRYLETVITFAESGTLNQAWFKNIGKVQRKETKKPLCNYHLKLDIRINCCIRSRLCYLCKTWTVIRNHSKKL